MVSGTLHFFIFPFSLPSSFCKSVVLKIFWLWPLKEIPLLPDTYTDTWINAEIHKDQLMLPCTQKKNYQVNIKCMHVFMPSPFSRVWLFATPWTVACQAPLSMGFSKWVAIPFSRRSSWPRAQTRVSRVAGRFFLVWATREPPNIQNRQQVRTYCIARELYSQGMIAVWSPKWEGNPRTRDICIRVPGFPLLCSGNTQRCNATILQLKKKTA